MRPGTRLGVDVGRARIGVARSDPAGILATPVETVTRDDRAIVRIGELLLEHDAIEVIVGLPLSLSGGSTASTDDARAFSAELASALAVPVRLVDERLSTVSAHAVLRDNGRTTRETRGVVDQVAAVIILQNALDFERSAHTPAGVLVTGFSSAEADVDEGQA